MNLFNIGFTKKSAKQFFELINKNKIKLLIDIRLYNKSQLAAFTKSEDLEYFLDKICSCKYQHCVEFAPTEEILNDYKNKKISWSDYKKQYANLIEERNRNSKCIDEFHERYTEFENVVLLCSEPTSNQCHRGVLSEIINKSDDGVKIINL